MSLEVVFGCGVSTKALYAHVALCSPKSGAEVVNLHANSCRASLMVPYLLFTCLILHADFQRWDVVRIGWNPADVTLHLDLSENVNAR